MREQPTHQMTKLILGHKDACKSRLVLNLSQAKHIECAALAVIKLYCTDVSCEWVSCLDHPVDFLEFLARNRNHHHWNTMSSNSHAIVSVEDEDAADGFHRVSLQYRHPVFRSVVEAQVKAEAQPRPARTPPWRDKFRACQSGAKSEEQSHNRGESTLWLASSYLEHEATIQEKK